MGSSSAGGQIYTIFGRSSLGGMKARQTKSTQFLEGAGRGSLETKTVQFREGAGSGLLGRKTVLVLGGWPVNHLCTISKISRLLGCRGFSYEICVVFQVSSRPADWWSCWESCTIFGGRQGQELGVYPTCLHNFFS